MRYLGAVLATSYAVAVPALVVMVLIGTGHWPS